MMDATDIFPVFEKNVASKAWEQCNFPRRKKGPVDLSWRELLDLIQQVVRIDAERIDANFKKALAELRQIDKGQAAGPAIREQGSERDDGGENE